MANITQIPSARVPLLLDQTTDISTEWYRFFFNLYSATGIGTPYADGQILIGDGSTGNAVKATLTAGANVSIVNGPGSITINVGATALVPGVYGSASSVSQITVDAQKLISSITDVPIYIDADQINPATFDAANLVTKNTTQTITGTKTFTGGIVSQAYNFSGTTSWAFNSSTSEVQIAIGGANAGIISTASAKFPGSVLATNGFNFTPTTSWAFNSGTSKVQLSIGSADAGVFSTTLAAFPATVLATTLAAGPSLVTGSAISANAINFYNFYTGNGFTSMAFGASSAALANQAFQLNYNNAGAAQLAYSFYGDGTAQKTGGGSWSAISDARLKDNVAPLTGALAKIASLNPVTYIWRHSTVNEPTTGFIAQEVQQVFPLAVTKHDPTKLEQDFIPDQTMSIGWQNDMTAYLVGAIKELKAELESVKAELATFKP
jgi:hypothetical protein